MLSVLRRETVFGLKSEGKTMVTKKLQVSDDEFRKFDITEDQFGPVMLSRLGKGLYKNPLHCIREYTQNSVDGISKFNREYPDQQIDRTIRIQAEGDTIVFHDNGIGMNKEEILTAISFGVSRKDRKYDVGFLGIGIFSGASIANRLRIYTSRINEAKSLVFEIDFKYVEENYRNYTSGLKLLRDATQFQELDEEKNNHYCESTLYIAEEYRHLLRNDAVIRRYISNVCPVDFPNDFEHRGDIYKFCEKYGIDNQIFDIRLNKITVYRRFPTDVKKPIFKEVAHKGRKFARYWYCENKERGFIQGKDKNNEDDIRYITYRWWNFLIDDPERRDYAARELFGVRADLMKNYFGDIHIFALEDIEPDLERTGFSPTDIYRQLKNALKDRNNPGEIQSLNREARAASKINIAMKDVEKAEVALKEYEKVKPSKDLEDLFKKKFKIEEHREKIKKRYKEVEGKLTTLEKQKIEKTSKELEKKEEEIKKQIGESQTDKAKPKEIRFHPKAELKFGQVVMILKKHLVNHPTLYNAIIKDFEALVRG
jgi:molecular chaperone HtpG